MAKNTQVIEVKTTGAEKSKQQLKGVSGGLKSMAKSAGLAAGAYFGSRALLSGIKSSIDLFKEQELAEVKLRQALGKSIGGLQQYASSLQKVTNFGDELVLQGMAQLAFFIKDEEQLKVATKATLDLASAKGMDLVQAADLVAKSVGSSTNALSRYGIAAEGAVGSEERLLSITDEIANLFGGQAIATTQSLSGALDQLDNAVGDTQEAIGLALAPTVKGIAGFFQSAAESASDFFMSMTENDLETTIRRLQEAGISAEALEGLQLINYQNQLLEVNKIIDNQSLKYKSVAEAQDALNKLSENSVTVGEGINKGISEREEMLGRLRGLLEAEKNNTFDSAGNYEVINEVTGKIEKISYGNLQSAIATNKAWLGYAQTTVGLQEELDGVLLKTEQITDRAENQLDVTTKQANKIAEEIEILKEKEKIEKQILAIKNGEADATNVIVEGNKKVNKEKDKQDEKAKKQEFSSANQAISNSKSKAEGELVTKIMASAPFPLNLILAKGAGAMVDKLFSSIIPAQYGADFIADKPQLMMVGEGSGAEHVQVTPLVDPNINGKQSEGITLNISGNVLHESFIEDSVIPQIREGLRLGENIGL